MLTIISSMIVVVAVLAARNVTVNSSITINYVVDEVQADIKMYSAVVANGAQSISWELKNETSFGPDASENEEKSLNDLDFTLTKSESVLIKFEFTNKSTNNHFDVSLKTTEASNNMSVYNSCSEADLSSIETQEFGLNDANSILYVQGTKCIYFRFAITNSTQDASLDIDFEFALNRCVEEHDPTVSAIFNFESETDNVLGTINVYTAVVAIGTKDEDIPWQLVDTTSVDNSTLTASIITPDYSLEEGECFLVWIEFINNATDGTHYDIPPSVTKNDNGTDSYVTMENTYNYGNINYEISESIESVLGTLYHKYRDFYMKIIFDEATKGIKNNTTINFSLIGNCNSSHSHGGGSN